MGLKDRLAHLAKTGDVPVFVVVGGGYRSAVHRLRLAEGIRIVASPRHAAVLLIAGALTEDATETVRHVHDQMAGPRATLGWGHPEPSTIPLQTMVVGGVPEVTTAIRRLFDDVLSGAVEPERPLLPDVDKVEWRGVGPYGHGGTGMTGGTPFGRPLALRAPSRDGLELDQLPVTIGPWFAGFPPGLALRVSLQGDVAQAIEIATTNPVATGTDGIFTRAMHQPTAIRELEMARAVHHLEWIADALLISGVDRLAMRADRLAETIGPGDVEPVDHLMKATRRSLLRVMTLRNVGVLSSEIELVGLGPVARAAGVADDRREQEPGYRDIGFEPVTQSKGDAWARFVQRGHEAKQAVELAGRAGDHVAFGDGEVEAPDGLHRVGEPDPANRLVSMLDTVLVGAEWGDLVTIVQSLDIDMETVSVGTPAS